MNDDWLSDCCDAKPIGNLDRWMEIRDNQERASGYCSDCGEKAQFHKRKEKK